VDEKIYLLAKDLKADMDNDPRFLKLNELNKKINEDEEVIRLAIKKDTANEKYNDLLRFYDDNHFEVIAARNELLKAKQELDNHPLVKEYLAAYIEVRDLLIEVNNILFKGFKGSEC